MKPMRLLSLAVVLVLVGALSAEAAANAEQDLQPPPQQPPPQDGPGPGRPGGPLPGLSDNNLSPGEIQRLFDAYLVMEAQQALSLSDQQYPQFVARLRVLQDTRRRNTQERNQLMGQLQRMTNPRVKPADDATIKERLAALQELESRSAAEMRKAYNGLDEVLNAVQQARFRVFEENIERRKIELLMRARQQNRPPNQQQPPLRRPNPPPPGA
jgi:hypothetical protein